MNIEHLTLAIYLVILLIVGFLFSRFNKNMSDYVRAGGKGTWWMVGSSILMSGISAFTFTGNASAAFEAGPSVLIYYIANCCALVICFIGVAAWFRQTRAYTSADIVRSRFGVGAEQFMVYAGTILQPIGASIQLWALAVFSSSVFNLPLQPTIIVVGVIVVLYSTTGGKWAVMATDFIQSLVVFSITLLVAGLAWIKVGGLDGFIEGFSTPGISEDFQFVNQAGDFPTDRFSSKWMIVVFFMALYTQISINAASRFLSVKDGAEAKKSALFAAVLMAIGGIIWFIPPMVARMLYANEILSLDIQNPSNASYAFIAEKLLPNGMMGIMVAAMFAATMSSMDSGLNAQMGIIVRNMIPRLRERFGMNPMTEATEVKMCRLVTLVLGLLILMYSLAFSSSDNIILFDAYLLISSTIGMPLAIPLFVGVWIKWVPPRGYFVIFGACLLPSIWSIIDSKVFDDPWSIQHRALMIFIFGALATFACMIAYRKTSVANKNMVESFFKEMRRPVDFKKEIGESNDCEQLSFLGKVSIISGLLISLLILVPNSISARMGVVFISGFVIFIGILLQLASRNKIEH